MSALFLAPIACYPIWALLLFGQISPASAAEAVEPQTLPQAQAALEQIEQQMASAQKATARDLKSIKQELALVRSFALDCVQQAEPKIQRLDNELSVLQPREPGKTETEAAKGSQVEATSTQPITPILARQLQDLQSSKSSLEEWVASCRLMVLNSDNLGSDADDYLRSLRTRQLLVRDPNLVSVLQANLDQRQRWGDFFERLFVPLKDWKAISPAHLAGSAVAGLLGLTIVAGALSVGIGFGLQNIVNNFVSGIIMLVERPVRHGDWIVVGNTEGLVERISIRTTTIRTFDRADVIVPNSDMISSQVTNWTLGNTWGRIKIPIGVGYSSDVETVIATLLEIANNHPDVVKGNAQLADPYVLFLEFGDSSLNFELRAHIGNINRCMHVTSDLNRAINTEFNKKGIEIPFPQRDVHFRNAIQVEDEAKGSQAVSPRSSD